MTTDYEPENDYPHPLGMPKMPGNFMSQNTNEKCVWSAPQDQYGYYDTKCGKAFSFIEDGLKENGCKFCLYCGREIEEGK